MQCPLTLVTQSAYPFWNILLLHTEIILTDKYLQTKCGCVCVWLKGFRSVDIHTLHGVDERAHISLFDDEAAFGIVHRVHTVHDLADLGHLKILHEVIVQNGILDQISRAEIKMKRISTRANSISFPI